MIVQHSFGDLGSGGPITALGHLLCSDLGESYRIVRMHQSHAAGGFDLALVREWVSLLRRERPDLVHIRGLGNEGFHGVLAARLAGCPRILISVHGTVRDLVHSGRSLRRIALVHLIEPATLRMATHVATVSRAAADRPFLAPYRSKLIGTVPNGVPAPGLGRPERSGVRRELGVADGDIVAVVVGRLSVEKGHLVLAEAFRLVPSASERIVLVVVGDGPDRELIQEAYGGVTGLRTRFLGRRLDVPRLLQGADVFLFPTLHENLSNALLEGMASGLPVVASAVGGNVEVLEGGGGVLVPPSAPGALAREISTLVEEPSQRANLGEQARRTVGERYTVERMVSGWADVYARILKSEGPRCM